MPAAIYRKKFRMLSDGIAPGHTLPPPVSLFKYCLSSSRKVYKFQLIDKKKIQVPALLLREFVTGQYLSVHSDEFETSDLFLSSLSVVSGPSIRLSRRRSTG